MKTEEGEEEKSSSNRDSLGRGKVKKEAFLWVLHQRNFLDPGSEKVQGNKKKL